MDEQELCKKRLIDLSKQAQIKGIVCFSDFLNLNEQNIFHNNQNNLFCKGLLNGGYEGSERQMVAFIPDALSYEWEYPFVCLKLAPQYPKFAEKLTHRDVLGSLMSLGIERGKLGDIICKNDTYYVFCEEFISRVIIDQLDKIRHTIIRIEIIEDIDTLDVSPSFEVVNELIASNRIDAIIAKAYHFSRSEASEYLISEKVFVNGKCITNCNQSVHSGDIVSVRGNGRFMFETNDTISKKGKLRILIKKYK